MTTKATVHLTAELIRENKREFWMITSNVSGLMLVGDTLEKALAGAPHVIGMLAYLNDGNNILARNLLTKKEIASLAPSRRDTAKRRAAARKFMREGDSRLIGDLGTFAESLKAAGDDQNERLVERARGALYHLGGVPLQWKRGEDIIGRQLKKKARRRK